MNVIIANKFKDALSNLDIDIIKRLDGEFDIDTIIDTFANFYFNRMILDITAIKDSFNIATLQRLSTSLDATKIILFLSDDPRINNSFLSKIISLGIYNFTRDIAGVMYLMDNPNSYRDVAQYHDLAIEDEKNLKNAKNNTFAPNMSAGYNNNQFQYSNNFQPNLGPGFDPNYGANYNPNPNPNPNANFNFGGSYSPNQGYNPYASGTKVIGFKDLTEDAGSTTLVYMLKKNLSNKKVLAVEIDDNAFSYFNDNELMSAASSQIPSLKNKFGQFEIVLIDLNRSNLDTDGTCTDVIYLLEPSTIKLNTLMRRDRQALEKLKDKKIVLNKSLLTVSDVKEFEYEAKVNMFYNIPPLDERKDTQMVLDTFLEKLGIYTGNGTTSSNPSGLFNIFKK